MLFVNAAVKFTPILNNPKDDNPTNLCKVLAPLLLSIRFNEDGTVTVPLQNLIGIPGMVKESVKSQEWMPILHRPRQESMIWISTLSIT